MKEVKELNKIDLNNTNGGCFAFDAGWLIGYIGTFGSPGGGAGLRRHYETIYPHHQH